jgi:hypothetical protein
MERCDVRVMRRRVGRVTIDEQPDALIVTAPFLSRRRAAVLALAMVAVFAFLVAFALGNPGSRRTFDVIGMVVVFVVCGYLALVLALNKTVTTVRRDRIVIRRGPIPMWPATTIDAGRVENVYATVRTGIVGRGGRMALDAVEAMLVGGRSTTLVDDAGDTGDAEHIAAAITAWLWSRVR